MDNAVRQATTFVVYPAALFDGWEVVREGDDHPLPFDRQEDAIRHAETQAALAGGGLVQLENWFGDVERVWEVAAPTPAWGQGALVAG